MNKKPSNATISAFLGKYIEKLKGYEKNPARFLWYVKHVEHYIKLHSAIKLKTHTETMVNSCFNKLTMRLGALIMTK